MGVIDRVKLYSSRSSQQIDHLCMDGTLARIQVLCQNKLGCIVKARAMPIPWRDARKLVGVRIDMRDSTRHGGANA
jgi:hypothetical protein